MTRANERKLPLMQPYEMQHIMVDLMNFGAEYLVMGGRLVFWLPCTQDFNLSHLPLHPCLALIDQPCQPFGKWSRRLVTLEKVQEFDQAVEATDNTFSFRRQYFSKKED